MSIVEFLIVEFVIVELPTVELSKILELSNVEFVTVDPIIVALSRVESATVDDLMVEHCFTIESSTSEFSVIDDVSDMVVPSVVEELSTVKSLLEGQASELELEVEVPLEEDDPPPLQEITRRLKKNTIRKKRSFFIYFP